MPTLDELPQTLTTLDTDKMLIERGGQSYVTTTAAVREPMQPRLTLATGKLLGRVGVFPGGPEPVSIGSGLRMDAGVLSVDATTLPATNASSLTVRATGSTAFRSLAVRASERVNVKDYGALGNGVVNDGPALQAAFDAASAKPTGGEVFLPPGTYRLDTSVALLRPRSGVMVRGAGRGRSVIVIDDSVNAINGDGISNSVFPASWLPLSDFHMRDLTVRGRADVQRTAGAQMMRLFGTNISIENCEFMYSRNMGLVISDSDQVVVRNCRVYRTVADGIAVWDSSNVIIEGNEIIDANDDAISTHSGNTRPLPVRSGVVIVNNTITGSQGIAVLGAKSVVISNNVLRRIMGTGIRVVAPIGVDPQGQTAQFALRITGNVVADVFRRPEPNPRNQTQFYIMVTGGLRNAGGGASPPGEPAAGSGVVTSLYGSNTGNFYANNSNDPGSASPAGYWNEISDNHLVRTLPSVNAVSDWGYGAEGLWVGDNGDGSGFYNGPVSESQLSTLAIRLQPAMRNCRIARNTIQTTGQYGIWFATIVATNNMDYDGLTIEGNRIADFTVSGIAGPNNGTHRVLVRDNEIDGDPRFVAASRRPGGTWSSATGLVGVQLSAASGFVLSGNAFRNVTAAANIGAATHNVLTANTLHCDPVVVGFSTLNRGVGRVEPGGAGWLHIIETCDPADALFGRIKAATVVSSALQPATGTYVAGHFVAASVPAVANRQALLGWLRLTTGSGHVAGTDWAAVHGGDGGALPAPPRVTVFLADGTWTKDPLATHVEVELWGSGGAGGNGGVAPAGTAVSGGGGGGGAATRRGRYRAAELPASVAVTVAPGGEAGVGEGAPGGTGGVSAFGTLLRAHGGGGGAGGGGYGSAGGGGAGDNNTGGTAGTSFGGGAGGAFGGFGASNGGGGGQERLGGGGGGGGQLGGSGSGGGYSAGGGGGGAGGGGVSAGNVGQAGGSTQAFSTPAVNAGGTVPGGTPAALVDMPYGTPGSSGAPGGGGAPSGPGGNGAAGQNPGGGGGGGGAARTGQAPGQGGRGGTGVVVVYEW